MAVVSIVVLGPIALKNLITRKHMSTEQNESNEDTDTDTDIEQSEDISSSDPLYRAALLGNTTEVCRLLLEEKAAPDTPGTSEKDTPLHGASKKHHIEVMRILLAAKANPNAVNLSGETPIHLAAGSGKKDALPAVIELFISKASLLTLTKDKLTPLNYATGVINGENRPAYNFIEWINSSVKKDAKNKKITEMPHFLRKAKVAEYKLTESTIARRIQLTHQLKSSGFLKKTHELIGRVALDRVGPISSLAQREAAVKIANQFRSPSKLSTAPSSLLTSSSAFLPPPPPSKKRKPETQAAPDVAATQRRNAHTAPPSAMPEPKLCGAIENPLFQR